MASGKASSDHAPSSRQSLCLFQSVRTSTDGEAVFFAGGPVWAVDWLSSRHSQWLAIASYRDLDEVSLLGGDFPKGGFPLGIQGDFPKGVFP